MVSTYGEGEAPDNGAHFARQLQATEIRLDHLEYAVLALGDRRYRHFCGFGNRIDQPAPEELWDPDAEKPNMSGDWGVGSAGFGGFGGGDGSGSYDVATRSGQAVNNNEWNVMVVDDQKIVNAFASFRKSILGLKNLKLIVCKGNIVVFTGILPICKDEEGLAAVLGHGTYSNLLF